MAFCLLFIWLLKQRTIIIRTEVWRQLCPHSSLYVCTYIFASCSEFVHDLVWNSYLHFYIIKHTSHRFLSLIREMEQQPKTCYPWIMFWELNTEHSFLRRLSGLYVIRPELWESIPNNAVYLTNIHACVLIILARQKWTKIQVNNSASEDWLWARYTSMHVRMANLIFRLCYHSISSITQVAVTRNFIH